MTDLPNIRAIKDRLGKQASTLIKTGMVVGLGSGSTSACFIHHLIERVKQEQLSIITVASSQHSVELAKSGGLNVVDIDLVNRIDITVDGADEIDKNRYMIKGGGGAHVREKILARESERLIILVDETKLSSLLGKQKLPVEILPFGAKKTEAQLQRLKYQTEWRLDEYGNLYLTDNGNFIIDIHFTRPLKDPINENRIIRSIPGVVETGLFLIPPSEVLVGKLDGSIVSWA